MPSIELKHQTQLTKWVELIKECRASGLSVKSWCQQSGVAPTTYYRWERAVLAEAETAQRPAPPLFAEIPVPQQVNRNAAALTATLRIGEASLDIYTGCDADQLKTLVELLRSC